MPLDDAPETSFAILVTFRYGASSVARYTSSLNPIVAADGTFSPEPSIEITMNAQTGGSQDVPVQLRMLVRPPLDTLTAQRSHSPVRVDIEEVDPTNLSDRRTLFAGMIQTSKRNPAGMSGIVELEIAGWRYGLQVMTNAWLADTTCNNTFGDVVCAIDLSTLQETGVITALDGNVLTLSGLTTMAVAGHWLNGVVAYDGLQIKVREYTTGSTMTLLKTPPDAWLGKTVTLTPGCDKRLNGGCRKYNNEARFTGFGFKLPAYNPLLEAP